MVKCLSKEEYDGHTAALLVGGKNVSPFHVRAVMFSGSVELLLLPEAEAEAPLAGGRWPVVERCRSSMLGFTFEALVSLAKLALISGSGPQPRDPDLSKPCTGGWGPNQMTWANQGTPASDVGEDQTRRWCFGRLYDGFIVNDDIQAAAALVHSRRSLWEHVTGEPTG